MPVVLLTDEGEWLLCLWVCPLPVKPVLESCEPEWLLWLVIGDCRLRAAGSRTLAIGVGVGLFVRAPAGLVGLVRVPRFQVPVVGVDRPGESAGATVVTSKSVPALCGLLDWRSHTAAPLQSLPECFSKGSIAGRKASRSWNLRAQSAVGP